MFILSLSHTFGQVDYEEPDPPIIEEKVPIAPSIRGASPENGADNLIRNAFVSARMDLLDKYQGVDAKSVSANSIKLYPAKEPENPVEVFITVNNGLKNILLEPEEVLEPNTEYVFEINSQLRDLEGIPFENYKSSFKTGTVELPKHIDKNKPRIKVIAAKKRIKLNALPEGYLLKKKKPKEEPKPVPVIAEKEEVKPEDDPNLTPQQRKKAKLEAAIAAKLAKYNAEKEGKAPTPVPVKAEAQKEKPAPVVAMNEKKPAQVVETENEKPVSELEKEVKKEPELSKKIEADEEVAEKKEVLPTIAKIDYPVNVVQREKPLKVTFSMPEKVEIRYMIKNASGEIVKKGKGLVEAGILDKTIPTKNLEPGKYKIAIKAGSLVQNHTFTILR